MAHPVEPYIERPPADSNVADLNEALRQVNDITDRIGRLSNTLGQIGLPNSAVTIGSLGSKMFLGVRRVITERSAELNSTFSEEQVS